VDTDCSGPDYMTDRLHGLLGDLMDTVCNGDIVNIVNIANIVKCLGLYSPSSSHLHVCTVAATSAIQHNAATKVTSIFTLFLLL
jgi:hypothetical protein